MTRNVGHPFVTFDGWRLGGTLLLTTIHTFHSTPPTPGETQAILGSFGVFAVFGGIIGPPLVAETHIFTSSSSANGNVFQLSSSLIFTFTLSLSHFHLSLVTNGVLEGASPARLQKCSTRSSLRQSKPDLLNIWHFSSVSNKNNSE